jgi:hypothetical protein
MSYRHIEFDRIIDLQAIVDFVGDGWKDVIDVDDYKIFIRLPSGDFRLVIPGSVLVEYNNMIYLFDSKRKFDTWREPLIKPKMDIVEYMEKYLGRELTDYQRVIVRALVDAET